MEGASEALPFEEASAKAFGGWVAVGIVDRTSKAHLRVSKRRCPWDLSPTLNPVLAACPVPYESRLVELADVSNYAACDFASIASGRQMVKSAPSAQFSPESVPPCASIMLRAIARPMPVPSALVEKKGSNN